MPASNGLVSSGVSKLLRVKPGIAASCEIECAAYLRRACPQGFSGWQQPAVETGTTLIRGDERHGQRLLIVDHCSSWIFRRYPAGVALGVSPGFAVRQLVTIGSGGH
jgi:hypothetical protein